MERYETKKCPGCERLLFLSHFGRHAGAHGGYESRCFECHVLRRKNKTPEQIVRHREVMRQAYYRNAEYRASVIQRAAESLKAHPERRRAGHRARKKFRFAPEACSACGTKDFTRLERHHEDYSVDVIQWLCKPCHWKADENRRASEVVP